MRADDEPDLEMYRACTLLHQQAQAYRPRLDQRFERLTQAKQMQDSRRKRPVPHPRMALPQMPPARLIRLLALPTALFLAPLAAVWYATQRTPWWAGYSIALLGLARLAVKALHRTGALVATQHRRTASRPAADRPQTLTPQGDKGPPGPPHHAPTLPAPRQPKTHTGRR